MQTIKDDGSRMITTPHRFALSSGRSNHREVRMGHIRQVVFEKFKGKFNKRCTIQPIVNAAMAEIYRLMEKGQWISLQGFTLEPHVRKSRRVWDVNAGKHKIVRDRLRYRVKSQKLYKELDANEKSIETSYLG